MKVVIKERGWQAHFVNSDQCRFRRNTLVQSVDHDGTRIRGVVVSTIGMMASPMGGPFKEVAPGALFETRVFEATGCERGLASLNRPLRARAPTRLADVDPPKADAMHEAVVAEMSQVLARACPVATA